MKGDLNRLQRYEMTHRGKVRLCCAYLVPLPCAVVPVEAKEMNWRVFWRTMEDTPDSCVTDKQPHINSCCKTGMTQAMPAMRQSSDPLCQAQTRAVIP